ncbi:MAG: amino acid racemase [Cyclobacteriaceae bacterium]|nr:amino acid racemase [Cyclobacteriaceae bacterium]
MNKMIGVVGGMGSYAGIDLIKKIYNFSGAKEDQDHLPISMISLPQEIEDRTRYLLGEVDVNPGIVIGKIVKMLALNGAKVMGIPCNTAHAPIIFQEVLKNLPMDCLLLNMIDEVGTFIKFEYPSVKRVGILSTTGTYRVGIYKDVLSSYKLVVIQPSEQIQHEYVHSSIYNPDYGIKTQSNPVQQRACENLKLAASHLIENGAEVIVMGCTEIPLAFDANEIQGYPLIDATGVLARALVRAASRNVTTIL